MALILGLESSCDETAAALVTSDRRILAHKLAGQESAHRPYGGIVPEVAARAHLEVLDSVISRTMAEAGLSFADLDGVAATAGVQTCNSAARFPATSANSSAACRCRGMSCICSYVVSSSSSR